MSRLVCDCWGFSVAIITSSLEAWRVLMALDDAAGRTATKGTIEAGIMRAVQFYGL